jgi:cobyrinic acid a,c-diamide synthase
MIHCPRLTIAGLGGDNGKTVISTGLCRLWLKETLKVIPFKKGPDYIDMAWLSHASDHPCYNIDLFLMNREQVLSSFSRYTKNSDIAVIEGNRGLYDGMDEAGSVSTAEVAKLLQTPVILVVDCTKVTRTVAAQVLGCQMLDPDVSIKGVILNKLAGLRHESIIRKSIENYCHIPVCGAIPRFKNVAFPGRHLGLVPPQEHPKAEEAIHTAANIVAQYVDTGQLRMIASEAPPIHFSAGEYQETYREKVQIGVIRDSAFQFYYHENLDALKRAGAELMEFSALKDNLPSDIDALYIGGGFPETHAEQLSSNTQLKRAIKMAADEGLPIYAECGGLMYLGEELIWNGRTYPMAGVLPFIVGVERRPQGHGYTIVEVTAPNPYFKDGQMLHGHEFHYSHVISISKCEGTYFSFRMKKGHGIMNEMDGFCYKNVLATYTHLHALGTKEWVEGMIQMALKHKKTRN